MDEFQNPVVQNIIFVFEKVGYQFLCVCIRGGLRHDFSLVVSKPIGVWFQCLWAWGKLLKNVVYFWGELYVDLREKTRFCVVGCL